MNNTLHTPAPWNVNTQPDITGDVWTTSPAGIRQFIAVCPDVRLLGREETHRQWRANARLIASAPDLLSALERLLQISQDELDQSATHEGLVNCEALANARTAIAKAKGGK